VYVLADAILSENGKWYLPYQPHATMEQFKKGFPNSDKYFAVKNGKDSLHRFNNKLLDKYNPYLKPLIENERETIKDYYRDEEQTVLTVPEWYLVFNPKEYADYLEEGNNPSDFPFYASIDQYWKLYDRSQKLVSEAYPANDEYNTMLQVIGVSVTMEYAVKIVYENTIGTFFGWIANDSTSQKEATIIEAHRAYSNFIYNTAWYEFKFMPWIGKVWKTSGSNNASWLRKWERTLFFTLEFSFKAFYAQLIGLAAESSYEEPTTDIYLLVSSEEDIEKINNVTVTKQQGDKKIIAIPRWGTFTETILDLSSKSIHIIEIGGNDEIVVSCLMNKEKNIEFNKLEVLYRSAVVTNTNQIRLVCILPVNELLAFVQHTKHKEIELEHVFDY
jgi:hypothetical protein